MYGLSMRDTTLKTAALLPVATAALAQPRVNLGRLSIARVFVSDVNGGRAADNPMYGARNLFDGGKNVINGINYSYWLSGDGPHWALVRFSMPVTVDAVIVKIDGEQIPQKFWVHLRSGSPPQLTMSPAMSWTRERAAYVPAAPAKDVHEVMVLFEGKTIRVDEIEILGAAPAGADLTPVTPPIDRELLLQVSEAPEKIHARRAAMAEQLAAAQIESMRSIRSEIDRATDNPSRARGWLKLNQTADELPAYFDSSRDAKSALAKAEKFGISFPWCEPDGQPFAGSEGYARYLQLWPDGPDADQAWWRKNIDVGCGDFEGTAEEYAGLEKTYSDFLRRFPNSPRAAEARKRLAEIRRSRR
jgi:hypothetical protein